jgi:hypothetical protein
LLLPQKGTLHFPGYLFLLLQPFTAPSSKWGLTAEETNGKPDTKPEQKNITPTVLRAIDPIRGLWSKVSQGGNFNKSDSTEVGRNGKPNLGLGIFLRYYQCD